MADKILRAYDTLGVGNPDVPPEERKSEKEVPGTKKDKLAACQLLADLTCTANIKASADFPRILSAAVSGLLRGFNDADSDVRMMADECLNRLIRNLMDMHLARVQVELYKEIKRPNAPSRSLRAALSKFADLAHLVKPSKCKVFASSVLPAMIKLAERTEEAVQETLAPACEKVAAAFGIFFAEGDVTLFFDSFVENLASPTAVVRRTAATAIASMCQHHLDPMAQIASVCRSLVALTEKHAEALRLATTAAAAAAAEAASADKSAAPDASGAAPAPTGEEKEQKEQGQSAPQSAPAPAPAPAAAAATAKSVKEAATAHANAVLGAMLCFRQLMSIPSIPNAKSAAVPLRDVLVQPAAVASLVGLAVTSLGHQNHNAVTASLETIQHLLKIVDAELCVTCFGGAAGIDRCLGALLALALPTSATGRVSVKSLVCGCAASLVSLFPSRFTSQFPIASGGTGCLADLLGFASHEDPLLRGNAALVAGSALGAMLLVAKFDVDALPPMCSANATEGGGASPACGESTARSLCGTVLALLSDDSSTTRRLAAIAAGHVIPPFLASQAPHLALEFLRRLLELTADPYWLVRTAVLDVIATTDHADLAAAQASGPSRSFPGAGDLRAACMDFALQMLGDEDSRVREKAAETLVGLVPLMYPESDWPQVGDALTALASRRSARWFEQTASRELDPSDANLSRVLRSVVTLLHNPPSRHAVTGCYLALVHLTEAYGAPWPSAVVAMKARGDSLALPSVGECSAEMMPLALDHVTSAWVGLDVATHADALKAIAGVCRSSDIESIRSHCARLLVHVFRVLAILHHVVGETTPPPAQQRPETPKEAAKGKDAPKPGEKPGEDSFAAEIGAGNGPVGEFMHMPHYARMYEVLNGVYASSRLSLAPSAVHDKFTVLVHAALDAASVVLTAAGHSAAPYAEEFLGYLRTLMRPDPQTVLACVNDLLWSLFGADTHRVRPIPIPLGPDVTLAPISVPQPRPLDETDGLAERALPRMIAADLHHAASPAGAPGETQRGQRHSIALPTRVRATSWRAKPRVPSQHGSSPADPAAPPASAFVRKSSISSASPLAKAFEKGAVEPKADKGAMQLLVRLFEPLVIRAMNLYCNTGMVGLQRGVLFLLAQLVILRVNYTLLDSDNMFLTFLAKQVDSIAAGAVVAGHELLPFLFEFFLLLARDQQNLPPEAMNVPKIVDLANSLLSSTSISCDRVLPALLPLAVELLGAPQHGGRGRRDAAAEAALGTQREALAAMLCSHLARPAALDVVVRSLRAARGHPERWTTLSRLVADTMVPAMAARSVPATNDRTIDALFALADALAPGAVRPEPPLFGCAFDVNDPPQYGRAAADKAFEWAPSSILLLRFASRFPEEAVASAVVQLGDACAGHASPTDALFVRVLDLIRATAANLVADSMPTRLKLRLFGEMLLHAGNAVLASRRARSRRLSASASTFLASNSAAVSETHALIAALASGHPPLVLFWLHLLAVSGYHDGRFWMSVAGVLVPSQDRASLSHGMRIARRTAFLLWCRVVHTERDPALAAGIAAATETPASASRFARAIVQAWEESAVQRIATRIVSNERAREVLLSWISSQGVRGGVHALGPSGGLRCVSILTRMPTSVAVAVAAIRGVLPTHQLAVRRAASKCVAAVIDTVAGSPLEVMDIKPTATTPGITVVLEEGEPEVKEKERDSPESDAVRAERRAADVATIVRELESSEVDVVRLPELFAALKRARAVDDASPLLSRAVMSLSASDVRVDARRYTELLLQAARLRRPGCEATKGVTFAHLLETASDAAFAEVVSSPSLCNMLLPAVVCALRRRALSRVPREAPTAPTTPKPQRNVRPPSPSPSPAPAPGLEPGKEKSAEEATTETAAAPPQEPAADGPDARPSMDSGVAESDDVPVVALPDASNSSIVLPSATSPSDAPFEKRPSIPNADTVGESGLVTALVFSRTRSVLCESSAQGQGAEADGDCPEWCDWEAGRHVIEALAEIVACADGAKDGDVGGVPLIAEISQDQVALAARFTVAGLSAVAARVRSQEALPADVTAVATAVSSILACERVAKCLAEPSHGRMLAWAVVSVHAVFETVVRNAGCGGPIAPPSPNLPDGRLHADQQRMLASIIADCAGALHEQPRTADSVGRRVYRPHRHVPHSFAGALRTLAIRLARVDTSLVHTYAVVHGKRKSEMDDGSPQAPKFDGLPHTLLETDHLQDVDILGAFLARVGMLGYEDQHRFEELWAALLSVIGATVPAEANPSAYEPEDVRATCLAIRGMTHILLMSQLTPHAGDVLGAFPWSEKSLPPQTSRTMLRARASVAREQLAAQGAFMRPLSGTFDAEDATTLYTANVEAATWDNPVVPHVPASYRLFRAAQPSPSHPLTPATPTNSAASLSVSATPTRGAVYLRNMIELFGHRLESTLGRSLLVLQETLRATNVLSDIFTSRGHYEWMLQSLGHIYRQHAPEDTLLFAHIVVGISKAAAAIWTGGVGGPMPLYAPTPVEVVRTLDDALGSPSQSLQVAALRSALYLVEARVDAVMLNLMGPLQNHLLALMQPAASTQAHPARTVAAVSCAVSLVSVYKRECEEPSEFARKAVRAIAVLASDDASPEAMCRAAMHGLERLCTLGCVPAHMCDTVCAVAADRIFALSMGRCLNAIGLMVTSVYAIRAARRQAREVDAANDDDLPAGPTLQTMEAVSTLFDRMRRGFYRESKVIIAALGPLLGAHFPPQQIMSIVMGEFLSSQQTHPELLAALLHDVFSRVRETLGGQDTLREWVLLSLKSSTQKEPRSAAAWSLACLFTSASRNPLVRALNLPLQEKRGLVTPADFHLLVTAALDFFHNQGLQPSEKKMFLSVFSSLSHAPFPELVTRCTHTNASDVMVDEE